MSTGRKGFTLIEALAATALLAGGIAVVMGSLGALTKVESRFRDEDRMERLAVQKLDDLVATIDTGASSQNGDFKDQGENRYIWSSDVEPSGVENLTAVTVTVHGANDRSETGPAAKVTTLVYQAPTDTAGAGQ